MFEIVYPKVYSVHPYHEWTSSATSMMTDPPSNSTESTSSSTTGMTTDVGSNTSTGETNDGHGVIIPRLPLPLKWNVHFSYPIM